MTPKQDERNNRLWLFIPWGLLGMVWAAYKLFGISFAV